MTEEFTVNRPRLALALASLAATVAVLAGCGGSVGGDAAVVGPVAIREPVLATQVAEIHRGNAAPVDQNDPTLVQTTLRRLILQELVAQVASTNNVWVTRTQLDQQVAALDAQFGGRAEVEKALLQSNVPPSQLEEYLTFQLRLEGLGPVLAPDGDDAARQQAVITAVSTQAETVGVTINPRFGTWDQSMLNLGPTPDDLSIPQPAPAA
jgi:outer membrane lipopolysaccharide assembly protein LptE/RlpB